MHIELQEAENITVERTLSELEYAATDPPETVIRKARALCAGSAMSYGQSARVALVMASAYARSRRPLDAIEILRPRLREAEGEGERYWRGRVGSYLANLYLVHYVETEICIKLLDTSVGDFQVAKEKTWIGATLLLQGEAHRANSDLPRAIECLERARSALAAEMRADQRLTVHTMLARSYIDSDQFREADEALAPLNQLLAEGKIEDRASEVLVLTLLAIAKAGLKSKRLADQYLERASELVDDQTDRLTQSRLEFAHARVLQIAGKAQRAGEHMVRAAQLCHDGGMHLELMSLLRAQLKLGKASGNYAYALGAMEALDRFNRKLQDERSRLKMVDFDSQRHLDLANEHATRLRSEVEQKTQVLAETVKRLQAEASHRQASEQRSEYLAAHDLATGLATRRRLLTLANDLLKTIAEGQTTVLIMLGIEPPSGLSETIGASGIDSLLAMLAADLQANSQGAVLGRFSDWRIVCIPQPSPRPVAVAQALELAEILCHALSVSHTVDGARVVVRVSAGLAPIESPRTPLTVPLANAETALESAMSQYSHRAVLYDHVLASKQTRVRALRAAIPSLSEAMGLSITFQPLVDAQTSATLGFESLVRWRHPQLGIVGPSEFIPIAEALTAMDGLGLEIARMALRDFSSVLRQAFPGAYLSINVSMAQLREPHFSTNLRLACRTAEVEPSCVMLEITESQFIAGDDAMEANLRRLRTHGFRFAIDDFGTGYSSLWRLSQLDVQTIKVARELVVGAVAGEQGQLLLKRAVQICRDLNRTVVAEGIEGERERICALDAGCDQMQGYLFSVPLPAQALVDTLTKRSLASA